MRTFGSRTKGYQQVGGCVGTLTFCYALESVLLAKSKKEPIKQMNLRRVERMLILPKKGGLVDVDVVCIDKTWLGDYMKLKVWWMPR